MGKLGVGVLFCAVRDFFDSLANYLRSTNSRKESIIDFECPG